MSKVADALVVVDPASVLADHGKNNDYQPLKNEGLGYVFTVAPFPDIAQSTDKNDVSAQQAQYHQEEEGGDDANLILNVGDSARFRSLPLGWRGDYQCFIDKILVDSPGNSVTAPALVCRSIDTTDLDPNATPFKQYVFASETDHYHEATTLHAGSATLTISFSIYDNRAQRLGGYSFHSRMTIKP